MQITGKITQILPMRSGTNSKGEWQAQQYILETQEQYPKKFLFDVFGKEKIEKFAIKQDELLTVSFDPTARESKGIWFNSNQAWAVKREGTSTPPPAETPF